MASSPTAIGGASIIIAMLMMHALVMGIGGSTANPRSTAPVTSNDSSTETYTATKDNGGVSEDPEAASKSIRGKIGMRAVSDTSRGHPVGHNVLYGPGDQVLPHGAYDTVSGADAQAGNLRPSSAPSSSPRAAPPNVVIFFADDWGFGDLGANWDESKGLTPHLDAFAESGMRFTDFHAGASVCAPSRAALLTGRLGVRTGVTENFWSNSAHGLPRTELTIAELLKENTRYRTGMIGKWHLGVTETYHPNDRGFDTYVGIPYSIDMGCAANETFDLAPLNRHICGTCPSCSQLNSKLPCDDGACRLDTSCGIPSCAEFLGLPLFHNRSIVEQPAILERLSEAYSTAAEDFISNAARANEPFFLYYAASHVHVPQNHDEKWDVPSRGLLSGKDHFAGSLMEMDNEFGRLMEFVQKADIDNQTLILVAGDNGPWECKCNLTGSKGPFQGAYQQTALGGGSSGKHTTWEGGHRVVGLARWPGRIRAGSISTELTSTLDYLPTILSLAGVSLPNDRTLDGMDIMHILTDQSTAARRDFSAAAPFTVDRHRLYEGARLEQGARFPFYRDIYHPSSGPCYTGELNAMRYGKFKAIWQTNGKVSECGGRRSECKLHDPPLVFDLSNDPAESTPINVTTSEGAALIHTLTALRASKINNVLVTMRSTADYGASEHAVLAVCCNIMHPSCACNGGMLGNTIDSRSAAMHSPF